MIKNIFILHMGFIILNAIGIIVALFMALWDIESANFYFKLVVSFILGILLGGILLIPMLRKYFDKGLFK